MNKILIILFLGLAASACSTEEEVSKKVTEHDIEFSVTSSDDSRLSGINFIILGTEQEVRHSSYSNTHLPLKKTYQNHKVKMFTSLEIGYTDNSAGPVGEPFEPYTITLEIRVDSEIKAGKTVTITEAGQVDFVKFTF